MTYQIIDITNTPKEELKPYIKNHYGEMNLNNAFDYLHQLTDERVLFKKTSKDLLFMLLDDNRVLGYLFGWLKHNDGSNNYRGIKTNNLLMNSKNIQMLEGMPEFIPLLEELATTLHNVTSINLPRQGLESMHFGKYGYVECGPAAESSAWKDFPGALGYYRSIKDLLNCNRMKYFKTHNPPVYSDLVEFYSSRLAE